MTIPQAIDELEDRGVPEVIGLLRVLDIEIKVKEETIRRLLAEMEVLKYGGI